MTRSHNGEGMDQGLVVRAQKGDQRAFETLTAAEHPRLFRVAHGILGDPHLAEDATQQAFLDIWRNITRLRDPAKFEGWSYRLLVHACYAEARRRPDWVNLDHVPPGGEASASAIFTEADGVRPWGGQLWFATDYLRVAPDGSVWVNAVVGEMGCDGVASFDGRTWTPYLQGHCIDDFDIASDGSVWVRASNYLYVITPETAA